MSADLPLNSLLVGQAGGLFGAPGDVVHDIGDCVLHLVDGVCLGAEYSPEQMGKAAHPVTAYDDQQRLGAGCQLDAV